MKKQTVTQIILGATAVFALTYQNCSKVSFSGVSANEAAKLATEPFQFDANQKVAGVTGADGQPSEPLRTASTLDASLNLVVDCSAPHVNDDGSSISRYEYERQQVLAAAAADKSNLTIPVEFAVSFGQIEDGLADWAHKRAILSNNADPKFSMIPVGSGKNISAFQTGGANYSVYYKVDHSQAKQDYIYGKNCFFDTVKIQPQPNSANIVSFDFASEKDFWGSSEADAGIYHAVKYMYFGWCGVDTSVNCADNHAVYGPGNYGKDKYPNRLFGLWPHSEATYDTASGQKTGKTELQIVKLYVADIRDGQFRMNKIARGGHIVQLHESAIRGDEVSADVKSDFDIKTLFQNRELAIWNLSTDYTTAQNDRLGKHRSFGGLQGVPQLLANLQVSGMTGTTLAAQYTPIVLDLGTEGVRTSGAFAGTFFNMAALPGDVTQQTAWLSGDMVDDLKTMQSILPNQDTAVKAAFHRVVQDGFLALADSNGQVTSSRQLLGDNTIVGGKTFRNGFLALQALAKKDCASKATKDHYLGPWDGDLYSKTVKVWVDKNRNGVVDSGELQTLKEAGVVAINTCNIVSSLAQDSFGNGTSLRSAFLFNDSGEDLTGQEDEIVTRLETGLKASGADASFRLAIDLIFKVNTSNTLESVDMPVAAIASK